MYRIMHAGEIVALCDEPRYVKRKAATGAYIQCEADEAEGVAARGVFYPMADVFIDKVDSGEILLSQYVPIEQYREAIASLEDAICELDATEE